MKNASTRAAILAGLILSACPLTGSAGTNTDNFSTSWNYLTNGVAGTLWEGIYVGPGSFPNATGIGTATGSVSVANANISGTSNFTVSSLQTDWENAADDGFFLFKIVTGDFDMSVHLVPPIDNGAFNYPGLMVRAFGPGGAPIQPTNGVVTENYLVIGRFDEFGFANMLTPNLNGAETDVALGTAPNTNYWLRIQRTNNVINLYESPTNGGWIMVATRARADFNGVPLQVGLEQADYGGGATRTARFEQFSLSGPNVNPSAPPSPATGLVISTNGLTNAMALSWVPGAGSAGSLVVMRTAGPITRQPSFGIANSASATFGSGDHLGGSNYVVFAASGTNVTVSNLSGNVRYYVAVYSYSGSGSSINFNLSNPPTGSQVAPGALTLTSITLTVNPQVPISGLGQATVTANFLGGGVLDVTSSSSYTSSASNTINMLSTGRFQGLAYGTATITASYQGQTNATPVTVINPVLNGLTHRYSFTSNANDSVAGSNGVTAGGAVIAGGKVTLDGINGFVDLPDNLVAGYSAVTFEAWVRDDGGAPGSRIYDFGNNTNSYMFLALPAGSGNLLGAYYNDGGQSQQVVEWPAGGRPGVGAMTHIVWTSDSATRLGVLYVNGAQVGINTNVTLSPATIGTMTNIWLGRSEFSGDPFFKGAIDEFRTYNVALSAASVLTNFQNGPDILPTGITGLTGVTHRWTFSEPSGTNILDSAGTADGAIIVLGGNAIRTNGAVRLAGGARATTDYVQFPGGLIHNQTDATIETWATIKSGQAWSRLFDFGPGNDTQVNDFFLSINRGGVILNQQRFEFGAPALWTIDTGLATTTEQQYHYVATWSATGGAGNGGLARWYRDGVLIASVNTASATVSNVNDTVFWLGRSQYAGDNSANAEYTEVRLYNRALTPDEINFSRVNGPDSLVVAPPVALDDTVTVNPGAMALINVVANDQGNPLNPNSVTITSGPAAGTAQVKPGGKVLYTHNGGPATNDSFTYTVKDALGTTSSPATVFVTISPALRLGNNTITIPNTPPPVSYQVVDAFPGLTITQPLALRTPPGNTNLLFIVERRGFITYLDTSLANPTRQMFLNISNQLVFDNSTVDGELGLLSLEFHPNFFSNGVFFVSYTAPGGNPYQERVSRFVADAGIRAALQANTTLPNLVDTNTQQMLFNTTKREFNHNGADLHFGNDGYLYISMGDEGGQYNVRTNAQRLDLALWSGILRIDVDKKPGNLEPKPPSTGNTVVLTIPTNGSGQAFYSIPSDNPFLGVTTNADGIAVDTNHLRGEFYTIGMRHPWRFSVDKPTGDIWVGIVGQDMYEGVYVLKKGANYGWPYYEAAHLTVPLYGTATHPGLRIPPTDTNLFVWTPPLYEYPHNAVAGADPQFAGLDVNGSLLYRGTRLPELTNTYLFGDFDTGGNIWCLRRFSNNVVTVERLAGMPGISAFGADPANGDVLLCNYLQNKLQRLVKSDVGGSTFPAKLSDTGIFADLASLTPNPGIVSYEPNVAFWSDYAIKRRWFTIPDLVSTVGFAPDSTWTTPVGMKWIKHFDLEMERGNPASKKRIETRVLVRATNGIYGVSYKWNDTQDDALLVADGGDLFQLTITNAGVPELHDYEIPSRSSCQTCHAPVAGFALTFNTREMNKSFNMNGAVGNQIQLMSEGGYFTSAVPNPHALPAFAVATDTNFSLEYRVRSYLAVNCVQCHQPGGAGQGNWNARPELTLAQTLMINGTPVANDGGNPLNKIIVPGDTNHSVLLMRLENTNGFSRMPPLASHQLDPGSIALVQNWITQELPGHLTYAQWITNYPGLTGPNADTGADPDGDGANNYFEYLTGTNPQNPADTWKLTIAVVGGVVQVSYPQVPNLGVVIEVSPDLNTWSAWDVAGNQPAFASFGGTRMVSGPVSTVPPYQFMRARLIEP